MDTVPLPDPRGLREAEPWETTIDAMIASQLEVEKNRREAHESNLFHKRVGLERKSVLFEEVQRELGALATMKERWDYLVNSHRTPDLYAINLRCDEYPVSPHIYRESLDELQDLGQAVGISNQFAPNDPLSDMKYSILDSRVTNDDRVAAIVVHSRRIMNKEYRDKQQTGWVRQRVIAAVRNLDALPVAPEARIAMKLPFDIQEALGIPLHAANIATRKFGVRRAFDVINKIPGAPIELRYRANDMNMVFDEAFVDRDEPESVRNVRIIDNTLYAYLRRPEDKK